jgi:uncharacterized membrane protein
MRVTSPGHALLATTLIGLGLSGLIRGDFSAIWQSVPDGVPAREPLAYLCAVICLGTGVGLLWARTSALAARVLLGWLLLWTLLLKGYYIALAPAEEVSYQSCGETVVLVAGAWVLYARLGVHWDRRRLGFATGEKGLRIARVLYALALLAFGLSHFAYVDNTAPLVPAWLPAHVAWAYFTGGTYLVAAVAVLSGVLARPAAVLSALQMGLFTLLVWVPRALAGQLSDFQWTEFGVSWALTAAAWVVADSYAGTAWLSVAPPWRRLA